MAPGLGRVVVQSSCLVERGQAPTRYAPVRVGSGDVQE